MNTFPIGVFDSGMGGLTVLRALKKTLPLQSFIYLGDTARLPYGTKSPDTVRQYAEQMALILVERGIKALVIACNTATTAALPHLQALLPDIPVLGVVLPGAMAAASATRNGKIAVLATETTIASGAYQTFICERKPNALVSAKAASVLVALAEEGMTDNAIAKETLSYYCSEFKDEDTLLLGCTHFPVFRETLASFLPPHVAIVDSAEATAEALKDLLHARHLLQNASSQSIQYLVTDSIQRFQKVGERFLNDVIHPSHVELIELRKS